jgi:hypothetical protein
VSGKSRPNKPLEALIAFGKAAEAPIREPGDLPSSESTRQTSVGVYRWMIRKTYSLLVLARAGGKVREDVAVLTFLKRTFDDAWADRRARVLAIYVLSPYVSLAAARSAAVEPISEAP